MGRCEVVGHHDIDGRGWPIHRIGPCSWNGHDPSIFTMRVRDGAVVTTLIGEIDGRLQLWHTNPGNPPKVERGKPLVIKLVAYD